jgi:nicotinamidase-related amidase
MQVPDVLPYGPLTPRTVHLCVDMQNVFAEDTPWHTPWMGRVLPVIERIATRHPARTIFTRFIPPATDEAMPGAWRRYWARWHDLTRDRIDPRLLELVPPLAALVPPAQVLDKPVYSAFHGGALQRALVERGCDGLVITGCETDVCVLATVMDAIDRGHRVVLVADALCSGADRTHDALMTLYRERFGQQVELADAETVLSCWL